MVGTTSTTTESANRQTCINASVASSKPEPHFVTVYQLWRKMATDEECPNHATVREEEFVLSKYRSDGGS